MNLCKPAVFHRVIPFLLLLTLAWPGAGAAATIVRLETLLGNIDLELFAEDAPATVANFLNYVDDYDNSFIHRSVPGFVIQGGGFTFKVDEVDSVATDPPIDNEFDPARSNLRGTVAMAKIGSDPDSATSQWFINLADNSDNLDHQNGGFTVFARVIGDGMNVADSIAALNRVNLGSPFDSLPLISFDPDTNVYPINRDVPNQLVLISNTFIDRDGDGVFDDDDNCPNDSNSGQEDSDKDGIGDVCEEPADPGCVSAKLKATGTLCKSLANCFSGNLKKPDDNKLGASLDKVYAKFEKSWAKAEEKAAKKSLSCDTDDASKLIFSIDDEGIYLIHQEIEANVDMDTKDGLKLATSLLKAAGTYCSSIFKTESKNAKKDDPEKLGGALDKAEVKFYSSCDKAIAKAGKKDVTHNVDIAAVTVIIDDMVADVLDGTGL